MVVRELPQLGDAHNQLGMALAQQGKVQEGINHFREALRLNPDDADAHNNLGLALAMRGEPAESARHFEEAIRLDPEHAEAYNNLGLTLEREGQRKRAVACYQEAIRLRPREVSYRARLAQALNEEGQIEAARAEYREIARIDPGWLDRTRKTAWTLATHPNSRARNGIQALQLARLVCQAGGEQRLESLDTLAAAAAEAGQFDLAVTTARAALTRATAVKESADVMEKLRERLQLYEASQPFRDPAGGGPAKEPATERKNER
jgi:tetratricopeptide (TPR) repeat protein